MSTKKAAPGNVSISINDQSAALDPFKNAVDIISREHEELRIQAELQADCIRRQDEQIRGLERGVSVTYHNGRPDRVIVDSTAVLEYANKYMRE